MSFEGVAGRAASGEIKYLIKERFAELTSFLPNSTDTNHLHPAKKNSIALYNFTVEGLKCLLK